MTSSTNQPIYIHTPTPPHKQTRQDKPLMSRPIPLVDSLISTPYSLPQGNTYKGATITVNIVEKVPDITIEDGNEEKNVDEATTIPEDNNNNKEKVNNDADKKTIPEDDNNNKEKVNNDTETKKKTQKKKILYAIYITEDQFKSDFLSTQHPTIDWIIVRQLAKADGFSGSSGCLMVVNKQGGAVLLVGISNKPTLATIRTASQLITKRSISTKCDHIIVYYPINTEITELAPVMMGFGKGVKGTEKSNLLSTIITTKQLIDVMIRGLFYPNWSHDLYLQKDSFRVKEITVVVQEGVDINMNDVAIAVNGAESVSLSRELGSLRFQDATNTYMKDTLVKLVERHQDVLKIRVLNREECLKNNYNLICAVNQASWDPCYLVAIEYTPPGYIQQDGDAPIGMF